MRIPFIGLAVSSVVLSGCASTVTAWKNDPLQSYTVKGPSIYAMTGDRRTAVIMKKSEGHRFCAESLPDAVAAYSAASEANAKVGDKASGGFKDAAYAGLLQTFHRTEIAEIYRQMGWNICLAWAQEGITDAQYNDLLVAYVTGGLAAIKTRALQTQVFPTLAPGSLIITPPAIPAAASGGAAPEEQHPAAPPPAETPGAIELGDGVKLQPASSVSGFCIKAAAGYAGTGTIKKPLVTQALPLCT